MQIFTQMGKGLGVCLLVVLAIAGCQSEPKEPIIPTVLVDVPLEWGHPVEVAVNSKTGYAYITNEGAHINVLDSELEQIVSIQTGERRTGAIAINESEGWVYVVNEYNESVTVMQEFEVKAILDVAGSLPLDIAINPSNGWAYVISGYQKGSFHTGETVEGNVTVVSGPDVIGTIPLGRVLATLVAVDPINGYVYVSGAGGEVVILKDLDEVARFNIGATGKAIDVDPNTGDVYILARTVEGNLFHFREGQLIGTAYIERDGGSVINLKVHPVTGDVYVVDFITREVVVVRTIDDELQIIARTPVGSGPQKAIVDPLTGNVYVANQYDDTVSVIYGTETIATIDVGWTPYGMGVNPDNGLVYVLNTQGNSITILGIEE